jgi:hypothetical protein
MSQQHHLDKERFLWEIGTAPFLEEKPGRLPFFPKGKWGVVPAFPADGHGSCPGFFQGIEITGSNREQKDQAFIAVFML